MKERIVVSDQARHLLSGAIAQAKRLGQAFATAAHVLISVTKQPPSLAAYILDDLGIDVDELRQVIEAILHESEAATLPSESITAINEKAEAQRRTPQLFPRLYGTCLARCVTAAGYGCEISL